MGAKSGGLMIVAALGIGALLLASKGGAANPNVPPQPKPVVPGPGPNPKYDRNLPQILEATVDQELLKDHDPQSLITFGNALATCGYPVAAGVILARANDLNQPSPPPPPPINPMPAPQPQPAPPSPVIVPQPPAPNPTPNPNPPPTPEPPATPTNPTWASAATGAPDGMEVFDTAPAWNTNKPAQSTLAGIQQQLNAWAMAVAYPGQAFPLDVDGIWGVHTADGTLAFQRYANVVDSADLDEDGIPGPDTQSWLAELVS